MRNPDEVVPAPATEIDVLRFGLTEIAGMAPGGHHDPAYSARRYLKEYAQRILDAAAAPESVPAAPS